MKCTGATGDFRQERTHRSSRPNYQPLSLRSLYFAEEGFDKAIPYKFGPQTVEEEDFCAERVRRRLNSSCKGLLEALLIRDETQWAKVQYLHRTVRAYVHRPEVWDFVASGTKASFDAHVALSACWLRTTKTLVVPSLVESTPVPSEDFLEKFWSAVRSCVYHSIKFEARWPDLHMTVLDELSQAGDQVAGDEKELRPRQTCFLFCRETSDLQVPNLRATQILQTSRTQTVLGSLLS